MAEWDGSKPHSAPVLGEHPCLPGVSFPIHQKEQVVYIYASQWCRGAGELGACWVVRGLPLTVRSRGAPHSHLPFIKHLVCARHHAKHSTHIICPIHTPWKAEHH